MGTRVALTFTFGQLVRLAASFSDAAGVPVDPDVVRAYVREPGASGPAEYVVGSSDPAIERVGVGEYQLDIVCATPGEWTYRYESSGNGAAAGEGRFAIAPSLVLP